MTQTAARHMAAFEPGDPEPVGLASDWADDPSPRRAIDAPPEPTSWVSQSAAAQSEPWFHQTPTNPEAFEGYVPPQTAAGYPPAYAPAAASPAPGGYPAPVGQIVPVPYVAPPQAHPGPPAPYRAPALVPYPGAAAWATPSQAYASEGPTVPYATGRPGEYAASQVQTVPQAYGEVSPFAAQARQQQDMEASLVKAAGTLAFVGIAVRGVGCIVMGIIFTMYAAKLSLPWPVTALVWAILVGVTLGGNGRSVTRISLR